MNGSRGPAGRDLPLSACAVTGVRYTVPNYQGGWDEYEVHPNGAFLRAMDVPPDLHPNCRCVPHVEPGALVPVPLSPACYVTLEEFDDPPALYFSAERLAEARAILARNVDEILTSAAMAIPARRPPSVSPPCAPDQTRRRRPISLDGKLRT